MIEKPIIIIGSPRAGTTILQRTLSLHPDLWHLRAESHKILEGPYKPFRKGIMSNRITSKDIRDQEAESVRQSFYKQAINLNTLLADPSPLLEARTLFSRIITKYSITLLGSVAKIRKPEKIRFLEKTPKNSLRVSMMNILFPDALYIALRRNALRNIDSLLSGWRTVDQFGPITRNRFCTYPIAHLLEIEDYNRRCWKFALVPEWEKLKNQTLADVSAWQYYQCNRFMLEDLTQINSERVYPLKHEDFVQDPVKCMNEIFEWSDLPLSPLVNQFAARLPIIGHTRTREEMKVLRYPEEVHEAIMRLPELENLHKRLGYDALGMDDDDEP